MPIYSKYCNSFCFQWPDRAAPAGIHIKVMKDQKGRVNSLPITPQFFGNAGLEHMEKYGKHVNPILHRLLLNLILHWGA